MSNPVAKAERSKAKDVRQMPAPDTKPKHRTKKKDKPWRVEYRADAAGGNWLCQFPWMREWSTFGKYRTEEEALAVIENDKRKHDFYEYRIEFIG